MAYDLETNTLVRVGAASTSGTLSVGRTAVEITVLQSETNGSTGDFRLADLHA
jgi:hypothetical protein